ncbi:DHS-like NAD/FAD-binding domain-containing protein, partial [Blyttiomyces helicus]
LQDFRSSDGLYNLVKQKHPKAVVKGRDLFDASLFMDPASTSLFYSFIAELKIRSASATATRTHMFLRALRDAGKLLRVYTQNIDGLELRDTCGLVSQTCLGQSVDAKTLRTGVEVVQLHGDLDHVKCFLCNALLDMEEGWLDEFAEGSAPPCPKCEETAMVRSAAGKRTQTVGRLRPNIILYNEPHPSGDQIADFASHDVKKRPDLLIVMGTSLKVDGLKTLVKDMARKVHELERGRVIFINATEVGVKEWGDVFDFHILGSTDAVVDRL